MSTTRRSDLVIASEILQPAVKAAFTGIEILNGSPAVIVNNTLPRDYVGGQTVKVPYFDTLGEADDIAVEGDALQPAKVTESSETADVKHSGKAFEATWWAQLAADPMSDPYVEGARQIGEALRRRVDKALIDVAGATLSAMTVTASSGRTLDYDLTIQARMKFGDQQADIAMIACHSKVLGDLYSLKDSTGRPMLTETITEPKDLDTKSPSMPITRRYLAGVPIYVSDRLAAVNGVYTTLMLKKAALVFWYNGDIQVKTGEDILANTNVVASHIYYAAYRYKRLPGSNLGGVALIAHS